MSKPTTSKERYRTRADLINAIKADLGDAATKAVIEKMLDATGAACFTALQKGDGFTLPGLGSFKVVQKAARQSRNPQTGKAITIPARKAAKFTPSKTLKDALA